MITSQGSITYIPKGSTEPIVEDVIRVELIGQYYGIATAKDKVFYYDDSKQSWSICFYNPKIKEWESISFEGIVDNFEYKTYLV